MQTQKLGYHNVGLSLLTLPPEFSNTGTTKKKKKYNIIQYKNQYFMIPKHGFWLQRNTVAYLLCTHSNMVNAVHVNWLYDHLCNFL